MFNLIPYSRNENSMFHLFDRFERDFWNNSLAGFQQFRTDVVDEGDRYVLNAELPGFGKEDIQLSIEDNTLRISAKSNVEKEENKDNYVRRERRYGEFSRTFDVADINVDSIQASYQDGVLRLDLPKRQPEQQGPSRLIPIQ